jgi:hypothetical protein
MRIRLVCCTLAILGLGLNAGASARDVVLPAGTLLQCTLNEPNFSSATAAVGDPVLCHLRGITEFGQQAFPRGSYLVGHLESDKDPGHFFGKGNMKLQFDRIGLPSGDLPLDAKIIATRGYKVNREGAINGKGHAKRDIVEWLLPPLWPWKVIMLPARGPRPALKGESVMTLRLMDDIQVPQLASGLIGPGWHYFNEPRSDVRNEPRFGGTTSQLTQRPIEPVSDEELPAARMSYASVTTRLQPGAPELPSNENPAVVRVTSASMTAPVFVLKTGTSLEVSSYTYQSGRISYNLASGGTGVISTDEIDWSSTTRLNSARGVRVTLRAGHPVQGAAGM